MTGLHNLQTVYLDNRLHWEVNSAYKHSIALIVVEIALLQRHNALSETELDTTGTSPVYRSTTSRTNWVSCLTMHLFTIYCLLVSFLLVITAKWLTKAFFLMWSELVYFIESFQRGLLHVWDHICWKCEIFKAI